MRIVVAHESVGTEGGVETYLLSAIQGLRDRGHEIALVYYRRSEAASPLRSSAPVALGVEERGIDSVLDELHQWRPDVCFSHNMGPLEVDRRLLARWPVVKMLHGYFGTCVSGLKMHAFPSACVCQRRFGPACLALYFPRRCGQVSAGAMLKGYRWASEQRALFCSLCRDGRGESLICATKWHAMARLTTDCGCCRSSRPSAAMRLPGSASPTRCSLQGE